MIGWALPWWFLQNSGWLAEHCLDGFYNGNVWLVEPYLDDFCNGSVWLIEYYHGDVYNANVWLVDHYPEKINEGWCVYIREVEDLQLWATWKHDRTKTKCGGQGYCFFAIAHTVTATVCAGCAGCCAGASGLLNRHWDWLTWLTTTLERPRPSALCPSPPPT